MIATYASNQTLKPTRVFWFAPPFVKTITLDFRARLSFISLDEILHLPVWIREVVTAESSYRQPLISLA